MRLALGVAIALLSGLAVAQRAKAPPTDKFETGSIPPDELGKDIKRNEVRVSDHRGKIVIVSFWASWCEPCRKELPIIAGIESKVGPENIVVLSINYKDNPAGFKHVAKALERTQFIVLKDARGAAAKAYRVSGIPRMIIVDRQGKVAADHVGYSDRSLPGIVDELNALLRPAP